MRDMTVGKPLPIILKFTLPLLISNFFQQLYSISDILLVGRILGVKALAAVGAAAPIFFSLLMVCLGFTNGLTVIVAQSFGAKNFERLRKATFTAVLLSIIFTLIISFFTYLSLDVILHSMNVPPEIYQDARDFLVILCFGVVMIVCFNLFSGLMRALGDSKTPLYFLIFTTLLNIVLNVLLIYYLKMGVRGSSLGTVLAMTISATACLFYIIKRFKILIPHKNDCKIDKKLCKQNLIIAVPMAVQFSIIALSAVITQTICNTFGFATIAAMTASLRIEQIAIQPTVSLGIAISTFVAQNYGANRIARLRKGVRQCSFVSLTVSLLLALLVFAFGEKVVAIFVPNEQPQLFKEVLSLAKIYLNITVIFYFSLGQLFIFRSACQGMGNSISPMISSIVELIMRVVAAVYLTQLWGYIALCYTGPLAWIGGTSVVTLGYFRTIWKTGRKRGLEKK